MLLLVCMAGIWTSCTQTEPPIGWKTFPVDSLYSIRLPETLIPGEGMHEYASLQYYDPQRDFYVLGIEDPKTNLGEVKRKRLKLKGYYSFVENTVFQRVDSSARESEMSSPSLQGMEMMAGDYYANSQTWGGVPLFYRIAVFDHPDFFFQLVIWTPYENACERMGWIDSITTSLRFVGIDESDTTAVSGR